MESGKVWCPGKSSGAKLNKCCKNIHLSQFVPRDLCVVGFVFLQTVLLSSKTVAKVVNRGNRMAHVNKNYKK